MNNARRIGTVGALSSFALCASVALGGSLAPPAGPVTPTMKDLVAVEPRTEINATNTPGDANSVFKITQPGSYYLSGNVVGPSGFHGIEILNARGVTIDLNGFTLIGEAGSLSGITGGGANLLIRNGHIRDWDEHGIDVSASVRGGVIEQVNIIGIPNFGIHFPFAGLIRECTINQCTGGGIFTDCCVMVRDCQFGEISGGLGIASVQNVVVLDCIFNNCNAGGIDAGFDGLVAQCTITFSGNDGIVAKGNYLIRNNKVDAGGTGILVDGSNNRVEGNLVTGNVVGFDVNGSGNVVVRNFAGNNSIEYSVAGGNLVGPIVTSATIGAATNPFANLQN